MSEADNTDQLKKYAKDLQKVIRSEKEKRMELDAANKQLRAYAEALNETVRRLKKANKKLKNQVEFEEREKRLQQKLIHTNKMTSLGSLASGIAHEINNPITFIMGNCQILLDMWTDMEKIFQKYSEDHGNFIMGGIPFTDIKEMVPKVLTNNIEGARRISQIIGNLKDFTLPTSRLSPEKINVNEVIDYAITILNNQIKKRTTAFSLNLDNNLPLTIGSSRELEQVIINIIQNALQALPTKASAIKVSSAFLKKSGVLRITVEDEGMGMEKKTLARIYEPFYTTREKSGGTGLGLYISYTIVKKHQGNLAIISQPGKGTTVTLTLPIENQGDKP